MRNIVVCFISVLILTACAKSKQLDADSPEAHEALLVISKINHSSLAFRAATISRMVNEANYIAGQLKLPTPHPIRMSDTQYPYVALPWFAVIKENSSSFWPATVLTNRIFDTNIPREERLSVLKIGVEGTIETTNFLFSFKQGKLRNVQRISEHEVEYYSKDLDKLIGKQSLINETQAHQLATQWLASMDVDVAAMEKKYPVEVNRLRVLPKNSTNIVEVPFYFVHWGWQYFTNGDSNHTVSSLPLVEVKILGTTKELVELHMLDTSFSRRPLLLITNALELIRMANPSQKHLNVPVLNKNATNVLN